LIGLGVFGLGVILGAAILYWCIASIEEWRNARRREKLRREIQATKYAQPDLTGVRPLSFPNRPRIPFDRPKLRDDDKTA
jgi:hypothetical protein